MKENKEATLKARVDAATYDAYMTICIADGTTPSEQIRNFVLGQVRKHALTTGAFRLEIELGAPYGRGGQSKDEYYVHAVLTAQSIELIPKLIPFLLPEFHIGPAEPFRIDSFYTHRFAMPGSRSPSGRLIGAKLVDGLWEGALFLYRNEDFGSPQTVLPEVEDALRRNIMRGLGLALEAEAIPHDV